MIIIRFYIHEYWKEEVERDLQVLGVRRWRELVTDRKKMEGYCSTGESPQRAVVPMEEEEKKISMNIHNYTSSQRCWNTAGIIKILV